MKRDLELIRSILLQIEERTEPYPLDLSDFVTVENDAYTISYHLSLLTDSNLIQAKPMQFINCPYPDFLVKRLTNSGHDYLDSIRDDNVWAETKSRLGDLIKSASLDIVSSVAINIIKARLGV